MPFCSEPNDTPKSTDTSTPQMPFCSEPIEMTGTNIPAPTVLQEESPDDSQNALPEDTDTGASSVEVSEDPSLVSRESTPTVERYPTRANCVPPRYLKDYELK